MKQVLKLERHEYAPELNALHYTDGTSVNTPHCVSIDHAVAYVKATTPDEKPLDFQAIIDQLTTAELVKFQQRLNAEVASRMQKDIANLQEVVCTLKNFGK